MERSCNSHDQEKNEGFKAMKKFHYRILSRHFTPPCQRALERVYITMRTELQRNHPRMNGRTRREGNALPAS